MKSFRALSKKEEMPSEFLANSVTCNNLTAFSVKHNKRNRKQQRNEEILHFPYSSNHTEFQYTG
jgi:hypothetical protein